MLYTKAMATLFLRGKVWWWKRALHGRDIRMSTRTSDEGAAVLQGALFERYTDLVDELGRHPQLRALLTAHLSRTKPGWIYAIRNKETSHIKIGFTTSVRKRYASLQTGNHAHLELLGKRRGTREREGALHNRLTRFRISGEWYQDCEDVRAALSVVI